MYITEFSGYTCKVKGLQNYAPIYMNISDVLCDILHKKDICEK